MPPGSTRRIWKGADLEDVERLRTLLADPKCVAVGEIGLDYHWMASDKDTQTAFFRRQIQLAKEVDKPIIVHDREAHGDTLELLQALQPKGVVHCFSGSKEMAKEIIKLGMYIGRTVWPPLRTPAKRWRWWKRSP